MNVFIQVLGIEERRTDDFNYKDMPIELYYDNVDTGDYPELASPPEFTDLASAFNYLGDYGWTIVKRELENRQNKILHRYWMGKGPTVPSLGPDGSFIGEFIAVEALNIAYPVANVGDSAVVITPEPSLYYYSGSNWVQTNLIVNKEGKYLGIYADETALTTAYPTANDGDTATVLSPENTLWYWTGTMWADTGTGYIGDMLKATYDPTNIEADTFDMDNMVEGATTKIFTDAERSKLTGIEPLAEVNNISDSDATMLTSGGTADSLHYHYTDRDRANHTGTQLASTISDFDTEVSSNTDVVANTAKITNANHTGEVTGATVLTVDATAISNKTLNSTPNSTDEVLINDTGSLKKTTVEDINNISSTDATDLTDAGESALHYHSSDRDRTNHTGTQDHTTISDYDTELSGTTNITAFTPTADYHPATKKYVDDFTHTGEVTGSGTLTIDSTAISNKTLKTTLDGTEEILINDSGTLKKVVPPVIYSGGGYFSGPITDATTVANTPEKIDATFTQWPDGNGITFNGTTKRFEFSGIDGSVINVMMSYSMTTNGTGKTVTHYIYVNGSPVVGIGRPRYIKTASEYGSGSIVGKLTLNNGDYIEIWSEIDSTDSMVTKDCQIIFAT